ncbi:uncharacterized protein LOC129720078 [Wyeomyia smithii]|uniref:uncharacterized protein LOC129720078 n=1 Tax=Wyeomyia smithii TaxID=174621 RepID=UPI002468106F|nr:uncharacterized protein LOC129720078 [Wyeomyia smithii]
MIGEEAASQYFDTQTIAFQNTLCLRNKVTSSKLRNIYASMHAPPTDMQVNEKAITNATSLPAETITLLSLGPKFAFPVTKLSHIPLFHVMCDVENIIQSHQDKRIQDTTRCQATNIILNFIHGFGSQVDASEPLGRWCSTAQKVTGNFLKAHPEILILSSDKGNRTVIMYTKDYQDKMRTLVEDEQTYRKVPRDPTSGLQQKNNNFATQLLNLKLIDQKIAKSLKTYNSTCPRIYGQPKAHKNNLPLRPVVPNYSAPTYKLCKYIANILSTSLTSRYNTFSSFELCEELKTIILPENYIMVSLDVVSLFTNVPRQQVITSITERWKKVKTNITLSLFLEIVQFCMEASYFRYDSKFYFQIYGTAMGSPLSPVLADIVLEDIITRALAELPFDLPFLRKYVDDLFLAIPKNCIETVLEVFNRQEQRLQFTIEIEQDRKLPFLDMMVTRNENQSITTDWYCKPIASGRMLYFYSFHQYKHKINVANNFIHRVKSLTTHNTTNTSSIIHQQLKSNCYPATLVSRLINEYHGKHRKAHPTQFVHTLDSALPVPTSRQTEPSPPIVLEPPTNNRHLTEPSSPVDQQPPATNSITTAHLNTNSEPTTTAPDQQPNEAMYRSLLYIPKLTDRLIKSFRRQFPNLTIATRINSTVSKFHSYVKDPINKFDNSNIIYKIPCNDCSNCYIGMTTNKLKTRLSGHTSHVNKLAKILEANTDTNTQNNELRELREKTALIEHCINTKHSFNFDKTHILDRAPNSHHLPFLEMCHIYCTPNTVNRRVDIDNLNTAYAGILHKLNHTESNNMPDSSSSIEAE